MTQELVYAQVLRDNYKPAGTLHARRAQAKSKISSDPADAEDRSRSSRFSDPRHVGCGSL